MNRNILLCGVGGQGTVLASKLISLAAMEKGLDARSAETIGMAQRGGSVASHVRVGENIHSPLIPKKGADALIGFEPGEAFRMLPYLKEEGVVIVNKKAIKPVTATLGTSDYDGKKEIAYIKTTCKNVIVVDGESICEQLHSKKALNVVLLGSAVASGKIGITMEEMKAAIVARVPEKFMEMNLKALELGAACFAE